MTCYQDKIYHEDTDACAQRNILKTQGTPCLRGVEIGHGLHGKNRFLLIFLIKLLNIRVICVIRVPLFLTLPNVSGSEVVSTKV